MIDLRLIRDSPELVREAIRKKGIGEEHDVDEVLRLDAKRRELLQEVQELRARRNRLSQEIGRLKESGGSPNELVVEMREVSSRIKELDGQLRPVEERLQTLLLYIPNIPHPDAPVGPDETHNVEVDRWGEPRNFEFPPKPHWELGTSLRILDFERAAKVTGTRFTVFWNAGARLVRALISFMIDLHVREHGYAEVLPPFLVNEQAMVGTAQLPRFREDSFKVEGYDFYLVPTAEVPVTNLHRGEILEADQLPLYYVAYTACFRSEAGSYGRDTRGLIRQHQFDKVELVKVVTPETSYQELEKLVREAGEVLRRLGLPYRVVEMCTGDLGFAQTRKYDLEVWMPSYQRYVEISSCSNFEDFQARRANIRFRRSRKSRPEYVHTLNGSGVAIGRTIAALLENYQCSDGSVVIPEALRPYMQGMDRITPGD